MDATGLKWPWKTHSAIYSRWFVFVCQGSRVPWWKQFPHINTTSNLHKTEKFHHSPIYIHWESIYQQLWRCSTLFRHLKPPYINDWNLPIARWVGSEWEEPMPRAVVTWRRGGTEAINTCGLIIAKLMVDYAGKNHRTYGLIWLHHTYTIQK